MRVERLASLIHQIQDFQLIQHQRLRVLSTPVQDSRQLTRMAQAAARTFPQRIARLGFQFKLNTHEYFSKRST